MAKVYSEPGTQKSPPGEIEELRWQLKEANNIISAIRNGGVDALLTSGTSGEQVYILRGADYVYREIVEEMQEGYITLSKDGVILFSNGKFAQLLNRSLDEVIGISIYELLTPFEAAILGHSLRTKDSFKREFGLLAANSLSVPVLVSANCSFSKQQFAYMIVTDLTEQKRGEQKFMFQVFDQAVEAIIVCDVNGKIVRVNKVAAGMFGADILQTSFEESVPLYKENDETIFSVKETIPGETEILEVKYTNREGKRFVLLVSVGLLTGADPGEPLGFLCTLVDITERKQTEEALRRSAEIQAVLSEIAEDAVLSISLDELYRSVHRLVGRVLPAKLFHITLLDKAADEIVVPFRADEAIFIPERRPIGKGMTEYIMRRGRAAYLTPAILDQLRETGEYEIETVINMPIRHYLGAPLIDSEGKPFGAMSLILMNDAPSFQPNDVEVFSIIAAQVSLAIERKRLQEELLYKATTDGLTGIFNRAHFLERADEELKRIHRYGGTCSLLMLDIDHFKRVNDSFGHAVGDDALRRIAELCCKAKRSTDLLGRIGGEEFMILLPETNISNTKQIAERLRQTIHDTSLRTEEGIQIPISVSIGIAEHLSKSESLSELMVRADKALYRAKNEGRNKVVEAE